MKTILKIPLYLEVEHENTDRVVTVGTIEKIIVPQLTHHVISFGNKLKVEPKEHAQLKSFLGNYSLKLVDKFTAMDGKK